MNDNLKNIPIQFLKNTSFINNYNTDVYISSRKINNIPKKTIKNNDNIWLLIMLLIILDII